MTCRGLCFYCSVTLQLARRGVSSIHEKDLIAFRVLIFSAWFNSDTHTWITLSRGPLGERDFLLLSFFLWCVLYFWIFQKDFKLLIDDLMSRSYNTRHTSLLLPLLPPLHLWIINTFLQDKKLKHFQGVCVYGELSRFVFHANPAPILNSWFNSE